MEASSFVEYWVRAFSELDRWVFTSAESSSVTWSLVVAVVFVVLSGLVLVVESNEVDVVVMDFSFMLSIEVFFIVVDVE